MCALNFSWFCKILPATLCSLPAVHVIGCIAVNQLNSIDQDDRAHTEPFHLGPDCSKLMKSLVNVLLKFQMLISNLC